MCLRHLFSCLTLTLSAMKPCHSYLMILFKMLGLSSGPQTAQEGLHSFLCPLGVTALCDMLRVHSGSNIHFPGHRAGLPARGLRASKARMSPRGKSFPAPPAGSASDVNRHLDKHKGCSVVLYPCYTFP